MNGATMRVREIMSTEVKTIQPDEPAWLALEKPRPSRRPRRPRPAPLQRASRASQISRFGVCAT
jgi:hypothetical protein